MFLFLLALTTLLPAGTLAGTVASCTKTEQQFAGSQIRFQNSVTSLSDCVDLCKAETDCEAVSFRTNINRCFLKKCGYADASEKTNTNSVELCCLNDNCDTCGDACDSSYPCKNCTGLTDSWKHVTTATTFNVTETTVVNVTCASSYINKGDASLTCVSGTTFTGTPSCKRDPSYWFILVSAGILVCFLVLAVVGCVLCVGGCGVGCFLCCAKTKLLGYRVLNHEHSHDDCRN